VIARAGHRCVASFLVLVFYYLGRRGAATDLVEVPMAVRERSPMGTGEGGRALAAVLVLATARRLRSEELSANRRNDRRRVPGPDRQPGLLEPFPRCGLAGRLTRLELAARQHPRCRPVVRAPAGLSRLMRVSIEQPEALRTVITTSL
jgi:hypothetical protein